MISLKAGKRRFAALIGKITTDSYSATIKKLAIVQGTGFAQIVPARLVAGKRHIEAGLEHAISALESDQAFSKNLELEFLIQLFGQKQVEKALQSAQFGDEELVLVAETKNKNEIMKIAKQLGFAESKKSVLGKNSKALMDFYGITEKELDAVSDLNNPLEELVIEKISFVALER